MIEKIALFGEAKNLVGIITQPESEVAAAPDLAFVLLNAGVIHHIGPNRLNVKLARRLAEGGFTAMRFDLSGIGDSRASQSTRSFEAQAVADIRAAMDHMQATCGTRRFVLVGLCSGADNAHATTDDERVHGLVMLDPYAYLTWGARVRFGLKRLGNPRWLASYVGRCITRIVSRGPTRAEEQPARSESADGATPGSYVRRVPSVEEFAVGMRRVLDRGGGVLVTYSGSSLRLINRPSQLDRVLRPFGLAGRIVCRVWPETNHTFTELAAQARLLDTISAWAAGLRGRDEVAPRNAKAAG